MTETTLAGKCQWVYETNAVCEQPCPGHRKHCDWHVRQHNLRQFEKSDPEGYADFLASHGLRRNADGDIVEIDYDDDDPGSSYMGGVLDDMTIEQILEEGRRREDEATELAKDQEHADTYEERERQERYERPARLAAIKAEVEAKNASPNALRASLPTVEMRALCYRRGWHCIEGMTAERLLSIVTEEMARDAAADPLLKYVLSLRNPTST